MAIAKNVLRLAKPVSKLATRWRNKQMKHDQPAQFGRSRQVAGLFALVACERRRSDNAQVVLR
jgi:hypothetical protein